MKNNFSFGNYIFELREKKKLSQAELGKILGVTGKAVSKWETGSAYPSSDLIYPLAKTLDTSVEELYAMISANKQEISCLRRFLNRIASYNKVIYAVLVSIAVLNYVSLFFRNDLPDKLRLICITPIISLILFCMMRFMMYFLCKNPMAPAKYIDLVEILFLTVMLLALVLVTIQTITQYTLMPTAIPFAIGAVIYSHQKRKR